MGSPRAGWPFPVGVPLTIIHCCVPSQVPVGVVRLGWMVPPRTPRLRGESFMPKEEAIEVEGRVKEALANTQFRVELDIGGEVIAHVAGRMRKNFIRIIPGDRVKVEISPYDLTRGRIVYRGR